MQWTRNLRHVMTDLTTDVTGPESASKAILVIYGEFPFPPVLDLDPNHCV